MLAVLEAMSLFIPVNSATDDIRFLLVSVGGGDGQKSVSVKKVKNAGAFEAIRLIRGGMTSGGGEVYTKYIQKIIGEQNYFRWNGDSVASGGEQLGAQPPKETLPGEKGYVNALGTLSYDKIADKLAKPLDHVMSKKFIFKD